MSVVKDNFVPTLIILLAGLLVSFAAVPLANTEFAEGVRGDLAAESTGPAATDGESTEGGSTEEEAPLSGVVLLLPLVKVAALMGIGVGLTTLVTRIIRRFRTATPKPA